MPKVDPQTLKGLLTLLVLALLADEEDYGYSLVERLRDGGLDDVAEGTVYPALARLERRGALSATYVPSERGPARKYYSLTPEGERELIARRQAWQDLSTIVNHITQGVAP